MSRYDYQVLAFQDAAPLREVGFYSSSPLTLDIRGRNFSGVSTVLINGVPSPEFVTLSKTRVLAQVPDSQKDARLSSVRVLLAKTGLTERTAIQLKSVVPGQRARGFTRLLQQFLRILFTIPGEDFQNEQVGGGLLRAIGASNSSGELRSLAARAVSDTETQLIQLQAANPNLSKAERLQSAALLEAEYVPSTTSLNIRLRLTAMDGTTGNPSVSV